MFIIYWILLFYARTWRVQIDPVLINGIKEGRPIAFWHGVLGILSCRLPTRNATAIVSASSDGDLLAGFLRYRRFGLIRGSAHRDPSRVKEQAFEKGREGQSILYAVDGSRGPVGIPKRGVFLLAQRLQLSVLFAEVHCDRYWQINSWDFFVIPKPFARISVRAKKIDYTDGIEVGKKTMMTSRHSSRFPLGG